MKARTRARGVALQVLYELDLADHPLGLALQERLREADLKEDLEQFVRDIVLGVWPIVPQLDSYIMEHAPEWPVDQIAIIDRNILRIALWEIAVHEETPLKVAINEAVELAKAYGSESASGFVNGVLGSLADHEAEIKTALQGYSRHPEN
jgi:N utilization substance protein B